MRCSWEQKGRCMQIRLEWKILVIACLAWMSVACADDSRAGASGIDPADSGFGDDDDDDDDDDESDDWQSDENFSSNDDESDEDEESEDRDDCDPGEGDAMLHGKVYAPNGSLPVSGALVYISHIEPDPIPNHVYCDECVDLPCRTHHVFSNADGSFDLPAYAKERDQYLVVRKGQFMRVTSLNVDEGDDIDVEADRTTLPNRLDPSNGMWIPNIAINLGIYDRLEDALAKLGLGDLEITPPFKERLKPDDSSTSFDVWENGQPVPIGLTNHGSLAQLLGNYEEMSKYHIIFVPCSGTEIGFYNNANYSENVRRWVEEGGKFYVSDWSSPHLSNTFPEYQTFYKDAETGLDYLFEHYHSTGEVLDKDLLAWLEAMPPEYRDINPKNGGGSTHPKIESLPNLRLINNWSGVKDITEMWINDPEQGSRVNIGHYVWVQGPGYGTAFPDASDNPMAISASHGCGKIMFTTYHTAEGGDAAYTGLTPQELILMYLILEIGVCQENVHPPE